MRWLFLSVIVILFQLFTYGMVKGVQWWAGSWLNQTYARYLLIGLFVFSNALFLFGMARLTDNALKISMTWLSLLWLFMMSLLVSLVIHYLFKNMPLYQTWGIKLILPTIFVSLVALGIYNAYTPVVRHITIQVDKPLAKPIRVGMVSDLHLGWLVGNRELAQLTNLVKQQKVELLLIPGDILDDNTNYYESKQMKPFMTDLVKAVPMGIYATLGNHDLFGHQREISEALTKAGVKLLVDETQIVDNRLYIAGRPDDLVRNRKATKDIIPKNVDKPLILLDHRPSQINENVQLPIDLQVSGHTHNGQIFPANFIVKYLNRVAYGHEKINNTHVVVSSGYGFWGVPLRLGSQSELWVIDMVGKN